MKSISQMAVKMFTSERKKQRMKEQREREIQVSKAISWD